MKDHPSENDDIKRDTVYSPGSDSETRHRQAEPNESRATEDSDVDADAVKVLPGTGGPDDSGEVDVNPDDIDFDEIRRGVD